VRLYIRANKNLKLIKAEETKDSKPNDKENVVDADFEDVKEKEEDKEKSA
jgi:hypothetical protein